MFEKQATSAAPVHLLDNASGIGTLVHELIWLHDTMTRQALRHLDKLTGIKNCSTCGIAMSLAHHQCGRDVEALSNEVLGASLDGIVESWAAVDALTSPGDVQEETCAVIRCAGLWWDQDSLANVRDDGNVCHEVSTTNIADSAVALASNVEY